MNAFVIAGPLLLSGLKSRCSGGHGPLHPVQQVQLDLPPRRGRWARKIRINGAGTEWPVASQWVAWAFSFSKGV